MFDMKAEKKKRKEKNTTGTPALAMLKEQSVYARIRPNALCNPLDTSKLPMLERRLVNSR